MNNKYGLRYYQDEVIARFIHYLEIYPERKRPTQLLHYMATGSGKTLVMAANILYLYKQGYCTENDKKHWELYHRKKLRKFLKNLIKYMKEDSMYERGFVFVPFKQINDIAGIHQKTIRSILFDELECQTVTSKGKPIDTTYIRKEQIIKLEKNLDDYVALYAAAQTQKKVAIDEGKSRGGRPRKKIDMRKVVELKQKGLSIRNIAKILNVSHPTILKKLNEQQNPPK